MTSVHRNPMYRSPWQEKPKKHPMCQDSTSFERGITCRPLPKLIGHMPPPAPAAAPAAAPPGEFHQAPTTVSVPEQPRDFPPISHCGPYVPPRHGSAWYKGQEFRIATPAVQVPFFLLFFFLQPLLCRSLLTEKRPVFVECMYLCSY